MSCKTLKTFGTVGGFCGNPVKNYRQELFLSCPYFEGSMTSSKCCLGHKELNSDEQKQIETLKLQGKF